MRAAAARRGVPTLAERIAAIHEEIDALIAERVEETAATTPGVPRGVLEQLLTARANGFCRCRAVTMLSEES